MYIKRLPEMLNSTVAFAIRNHYQPNRMFSIVSCFYYKLPRGYDTGIKIYSCITKSNVPLILRNKNCATWYTCGPTVYDSSHIGHASCYMKLDIIQRILQNYFGINLVTAMNITDIDDKIIKKSLETGKSCQDISRLYENEFWNNLKALQIQLPHIKIRVTENISLIIRFIEEILHKDFAYVGSDNSVYFKINKLPNYGKLQKINLDNLEHNSKQSNVDFVLWKAKKLNEPYWSSPWGDGRPGWHIECSALATRIFGNCIDFHAGGLDLRFPHHENEEAQSCAFHSTEQWVNYWIHTGQLMLKDQNIKMSKSLKNTITIDEFLKKYKPDDLRMACILSNYRNSMEFSDDMMKMAGNVCEKFHAFKSDCEAFFKGKKINVAINSEIIFQKLSETENNIDKCFKNDFDTAKSISHLSDLTTVVSRMINTTNQIVGEDNSLDLLSVRAAYNFIAKILHIFGFNRLWQSEMHPTESNLSEAVDIENIIEEIVLIRKQIRGKAIETKNKELFQICDEIRTKLSQFNVEIKDHNKESSWSIAQTK